MIQWYIANNTSFTFCNLLGFRRSMQLFKHYQVPKKYFEEYLLRAIYTYLLFYEMISNSGNVTCNTIVCSSYQDKNALLMKIWSSFIGQRILFWITLVMRFCAIMIKYVLNLSPFLSSCENYSDQENIHTLYMIEWWLILNKLNLKWVNFQE